MPVTPKAMSAISPGRLASHDIPFTLCDNDRLDHTTIVELSRRASVGPFASRVREGVFRDGG